MKAQTFTIRKLMFQLVILVLLLCQTVDCACTATLSDYKINQLPLWRVTFSPGAVGLMAYIRVKFDSTTGLRPTSNVKCYAQGSQYDQSLMVDSSTQELACAVETQSTDFIISIGKTTGTFGTSGYKSLVTRGLVSYQFNIAGIQSAPSAKVITGVACEMCVANPCGSEPTQASDPQPANSFAVNQVSGIQFQPAVMGPDTIVVSSDSLVNSADDATTTFTVNINNRLPKESRVDLLFPYTNMNFITKGTGVAGQDYITKGVAEDYTITAKYGPAAALQPLAIKKTDYRALVSNDKMEVYLDNQAEIPPFQYLEFKIKATRNPPSLNPIYGFECETYDVDGNEIEKSQGSYYMHTDVASNFINNALGGQETKMYIKDGDSKVGATGKTYVFQMYINGGMPSGAKMVLQLPREGWPLNCGATSSWPTITCIADCKCTNAGITCDAGLNALTFSDCWPALADYVYAPGPIRFELGNIVNPISIKKEYFQLTTYEVAGASSYKIDETNSLFYLSFTMGEVFCYSVLPTDPTIFSSLGAYNFTMAFQHDVPSDYILKITLPSAIPVLQKAGCPVIGLGSSYTCAADSANGVITLTGLADPGKFLPAMTNITFSIQRTLQNPGAFIAPGKYSFLLTTASGGDVDGGTYIDTNATHYKGSTITSFSATISSTAVGETGVSILFTLQPLATVPKGAYFVLTVPEQFEPEGDGKQGRDCMQTPLVPPYALGLTGQYQKCDWDWASRNMTLTGGFSGGPTSASAPLLRFTVPGWQNPRSATDYNGTGRFNITIYTYDDKEMYRFNLTEGPWFRIDKLRVPQSLWYSRTSFRNGVQSNFTLTLEPANDLYNFDIVTISLPTPVRFTLRTKCIGASYWIRGELNCSISQTLDQVRFVIGVAGAQLKSYNGEYNVPGTRRLEETGFLKEPSRNLATGRPDPKRDRYAIPTFIPKGQLVEITLTSITSPPSLKPAIGSITYLVTTNSGLGVERQTTGLPVGNTEPGIMLTELASAIPNFMEKGAPANYTIKFVPINFEPNMKILFTFPSQITFPSVWNESSGCVGIKGLSQPEIICQMNPRTNTILITNGLSSSVRRPDEIIIEFLNLTNPTENVRTSPFQIKTLTSDGWLIDELQTTPPLFVNFYCTFPCQTCNETLSTQCFTCYTDGTPYIYLYKDRCRDECPAGMYEQKAIEQEIDLTKQAVASGGASVILYNPAESAQWETKIEPATCKFCKSPCATCGKSAEDCLTCIPRYLHYPVDNTCYAEVHWYFPFLAGVIFFGFSTVLISGCARTMNVITSLLPLYCILEDGVWAALVYLYLTGQVSGQRPLSIMSLAVHILLNLFWIFVHYKLMMQEATKGYLQLFQAFPCSSWFFQSLAYMFNFKFSTILVSNFAGRPRFSGTYSADSWQKFNIFSVLYIALVYLPFTADFYLYFIEYGLRQLTSYVFLEACAVMTVISMILLLLLLQECSCKGIEEKDLGGRAGLKKDKSMSKKKRRALRSGMGNEEGDYDDEYDSEEDYYEEDDAQPRKELDESEEGSEADSQTSTIRKTKLRDSRDDAKNLDMLEQLATQMKEERDILEAEKAAMVKEEQRLLKEKQRQAKEYEQLREGWAKEKKKLRKEVKTLKHEKAELIDNVDQQVNERLGAWDGNPRKDLLGNVIVALPPAIYDFIDFEKEIEGDEEYWLQNLSAVGGDISDRSGLYREKDASLIEHVEHSEAQLSYLGTGRSMEAEQEQRAVMDQGGIMGDDVSANKSLNATEQAYLSKDDAVYGQVDKSLKRDATEQEFLDNASAIFSQGDNITGRSFNKEKDGTDIEQLEGRSAEFGSVSAAERKLSQKDASQRNPIHDQEGHSGESDEGIVADHTPFNGIKDAIANQERLRRSNKNLSGSDEDSQADEDNRPSGRQRRIKQVLYSDKSESSVDEMMQDTPSNYNIANGRLEGKSMGLKAILLFAKNQGVNLGGMKQGATGATLNQLAQIQEESVVTPQETQHPNLADGPRAQPGQEGKGKTKPTPGMAKRFKEPAEGESQSLSSRNRQDQDLQNIRKNNFV